MAGSSWFSNMISLAAISAASLGLKPRFTFGTGNEAFGIEGRDGLVCSTIMSLKLGRGESVVSLLCLRIAEKRRKRKRPVARGAGPACKLLIRHPREHFRHRNFQAALFRISVSCLIIRPQLRENALSLDRAIVIFAEAQYPGTPRFLVTAAGRPLCPTPRGRSCTTLPFSNLISLDFLNE